MYRQKLINNKTAKPKMKKIMKEVLKMKKFNEIYAEALKNESLRNELMTAVQEKKLAGFLKAHDCDTDIEEIRNFLTEQQAKANRGDIELNIDELEDVAGGANRFIASLLAGLTLATAMTPVAAAAAEDTSAPTGYVTEIDMEDDDTIDFDLDIEEELTEETATTTATEIQEETTTTTAFEEVALPTTEAKEKEKDWGTKMNDFMDAQIQSLWGIGKEKLGENLPDITEKIFDAIPVANYLNKIGVGKALGGFIASTLGIAPNEEPTMSEIKEQLKEISNQIEDAKNQINEHSDSNLARAIDAMQNIADVKSYRDGMQELATSFSTAQGVYAESSEATDEEILVQLADICGSNEFWNVKGTFANSLSTVGSYISGQKNFTGNQNFYDSLYSIAVKEGAVFSGQAKNEVEGYITDTLETYVAAYALAMASLDAQETLVNIKDSGNYEEFIEHLPASMRDTCSKIKSSRYSIAAKKKELTKLFMDIEETGTQKTVLGQYEKFENMSSGIFIYRDGQFDKHQKEIVLGSAKIKSDPTVSGKGSDAHYKSVLNSTNNPLALDQLLKHAKTYEKSIAEVLTESNFEIPENTRYILADSKISKKDGGGDGRRYPGTSDGWAYNIDIFYVKAYDIYSKDIEPVDVNIKSIRHSRDYLGGKTYEHDPQVTELPEINFLTFCEKTDTTESALGKQTTFVGQDRFVISNGEFTLTEDMNVSKPIVVQAGVKATIDLNGFALNCTDNSAPAITLEEGATLTITDNSESQTGSLKGYTTANGGAVFVKQFASCTIENITIAGSASNNGGAVYNEGTARIENCVLDNNGGTSNGGAVVNYGDITITGTEISRCKTDGAGGAVRNYGTCNVDHTSITECTAKDGGAFYNAGTLTMNDITMSNNKTTSCGGGAVSNHGTLRITGFEINNNTSTGNGGAIWSDTSVYLEKGTMDGNKSNITGDDNGGGAVYMKKGTLEIHDATISNNSCNSDGGAIMCDSGSSTIKAYNTDFTGNYAPSDGGAIKTKADNEFRNCTFTKNSCGNKGGAIDLASSAKGNFYACTIKDNTAPKGSALRYDSHAKYSFNEGTQVTGGIY